MLGIYIHVPFCKRRCYYCDFCSSVRESSTVSDYVGAVLRNINAVDCKGENIDTVYFGGGTPSLMTPEQISLIMSSIRSNFALSPLSEITVEANPGTVDKIKLEKYREAGVNRISFGVQSCKDNELYALGRLHNFSQAKEAVCNAISAGFKNISCDIMIGIPEQTVASLRESVDTICGLGVQHISAYMLKIEPGTAFDCPEVRAKISDDDTVAEMYLDTVKRLSERGFVQYEISNFSLLGYQSRHNLKYWTGERYLGFGPSAHSYFGGKRFFVPPDIRGFINSERQQTVSEDDSPDQLLEYILLGLRLCEGISLDRVKRLGGDPIRLTDAAKVFSDRGLATVSGDRIKLTPEGFLVSNGIISRLIDSCA